MTLSLQELSDRFEIQDLLVTYADAIDRKDFDALDDLFTPDAVIDYTAVGGIRGTLPEIKEFLATGMAWFSSFQHLTSAPKVVFDGDTATGRAICHNPMVIDLPDTGPHTMFIGIWYVDTYVRTEQGWRFGSRTEEKSYVHNAPPGFSAG